MLQILNHRMLSSQTVGIRKTAETLITCISIGTANQKAKNLKHCALHWPLLIRKKLKHGVLIQVHACGFSFWHRCRVVPNINGPIHDSVLTAINFDIAISESFECTVLNVKHSD